MKLSAACQLLAATQIPLARMRYVTVACARVQVFDIPVHAIHICLIRTIERVLHRRMPRQQIREIFIAVERAFECARRAIDAGGGVAPQVVDTAGDNGT